MPTKWVKLQILTRCKVNTWSMHTLRLLICYQRCLMPCFYTTISTFYVCGYYYCFYYKEWKGFITDKDNYKPIAITSVISKILELLLLDRLQSQLTNALFQYIFVILMLQKHLIVLIIGVSLRNLLNVLLIFLWFIFSYFSIINKHFVYVGITNSPNSILCLMV